MNLAPATAFQAREVGYFDPNPSKNAIEMKNNHTVYYHVFSFTNQRQVKASNKDAGKLCRNLDLCLLGKAKVKYTKLLLGPFQIGLCKDCNAVEEWCKTLETKFKRLPAVSLDAFKMTQYTVGNVRRCRDPMDYVQTVILHARGARIPKDSYQLALAIYHYINGQVHQNIQCPRKKTTVKDTIARICKVQDVWFNTYPGRQANIVPFQYYQADQQVQGTGPVQPSLFNASQASGRPNNTFLTSGYS